MKTLLTTTAAAALLAGVTIAAAQTGLPADQQTTHGQSQGQERNPNGSMGGSIKNPSPTGTTGSGMTGGTLTPSQDQTSGTGAEVKKGGVNKGEVGGKAQEGH